MNDLWPWLMLAGLGAYHGINPGMGWLFAVALGLQEKSRQAVTRALVPIALGHAISVGTIVLLVALAQIIVPGSVLRWLCAIALFAFGLYKLFRSRHPRWVGMRVGFKDLTLWSFLMASAHGAGLMLVPIMLQWSSTEHAHHHGLHPSFLEQSANKPALLFAAVGVHTISLLLVTAAVALLVYEKLGLAILRQAWFNFDLLWAIALLVAGVIALVF